MKKIIVGIALVFVLVVVANNTFAAEYASKGYCFTTYDRLLVEVVVKTNSLDDWIQIDKVFLNVCSVEAYENDKVLVVAVLQITDRKGRMFESFTRHWAPDRLGSLVKKAISERNLKVKRDCVFFKLPMIHHGYMVNEIRPSGKYIAVADIGPCRICVEDSVSGFIFKVWKSGVAVKRWTLASALEVVPMRKW